LFVGRLGIRLRVGRLGGDFLFGHVLLLRRGQ
jgi:hypothetical protein